MLVLVSQWVMHQTQVQAIADWVAPSVELDGAAIAIEKFLLN